MALEFTYILVHAYSFWFKIKSYFSQLLLNCLKAFKLNLKYHSGLIYFDFIPAWIYKKFLLLFSKAVKSVFTNLNFWALLVSYFINSDYTWYLFPSLPFYIPIEGLKVYFAINFTSYQSKVRISSYVYFSTDSALFQNCFLGYLDRPSELTSRLD